MIFSAPKLGVAAGQQPAQGSGFSCANTCWKTPPGRRTPRLQAFRTEVLSEILDRLTTIIRPKKGPAM